MKITELQERLRKYKVELAASTIRKLAHEGIITPPPRYDKKEKKGKGGPSNWSEDSLADIVAFWELTHDLGQGVVPKGYVGYFREVWDALFDPKLVKRMFKKESKGEWRFEDTPFVFRRGGNFDYRYECDPTFARWIAIRKKILNDLPMKNPISLTYRWRVYFDASDDAPVALGEGPQIEELNEADYRQDRVYFELVKSL